MPGSLRGDSDGALQAPVVTVALSGSTGIVASWTTDPRAVSWDISVLDGTGRAVRSLLDLDASTARFTGLTPGRTYRVRVVASDLAGVRSPAGEGTVAMPRDLTRPGGVRLGRRTVMRTSVKVTWSAARDDVGVARYELERRVGSRWIRARAAASARSAIVGRVPARTTTAMRIRAVDAAGNAGAWTAFSIRR